MKIISIGIYTFLILLQFSCVFQGGSDTETGRNDSDIHGLILDKDSLPIANVEVQLFKSTHNPILKNSPEAIVFTNNIGEFTFRDLDEAFTYNIFGKNRLASTLAFRGNIKPDTNKIALELDIPVRLEMTITYIDYNYNPLDSTLLYFPGTNIVARCDSIAVLDSLAIGVVNLELENSLNEIGVYTLPNNNGDWQGVTMGMPGDTIRVEVTKRLGQPYEISLINGTSKRED